MQLNNMSSPEKKELLIDQYLSGELSGDDLAEFERMLEQDDALQEEMQLHQQIAGAIQEQDVAEFRNVVGQVIREKRQTDRGLMYKIAAGLVPLLIATFFGYNYWLGQESNDELFERYMYPYENLLTVRSDSGNDGSDSPAGQMDLRAAMAYYDNGDYSKALQFLNKLNGKPHDLVYLYKGISYVYLGELDSALMVLRVPIQSKDGIYKFPALYYTAMAYLKDDDLEATKKTLELLEAQSPQPYKNLASELLKKLD